MSTNAVRAAPIATSVATTYGCEVIAARTRMAMQSARSGRRYGRMPAHGDDARTSASGPRTARAADAARRGPRVVGPLRGRRRPRHRRHRAGGPGAGPLPPRRVPGDVRVEDATH